MTDFREMEGQCWEVAVFMCGYHIHWESCPVGSPMDGVVLSWDWVLGLWTANPHPCTAGSRLVWWASAVSASPSSIVPPSDSGPWFFSGDSLAYHSQSRWFATPTLIWRWACGLSLGVQRHSTSLAKMIGYEKQIDPMTVNLEIFGPS